MVRDAAFESHLIRMQTSTNLTLNRLDLNAPSPTLPPNYAGTLVHFCSLYWFSFSYSPSLWLLRKGILSQKHRMRKLIWSQRAVDGEFIAWGEGSGICWTQSLGMHHLKSPPAAEHMWWCLRARLPHAYICIISSYIFQYACVFTHLVCHGRREAEVVFCRTGWQPVEASLFTGCKKNLKEKTWLARSRIWGYWFWVGH